MPGGEDAGGTSPPDATVAVLGLGNVLMGDDALGPTVVKVLEGGYEFGPQVSVQELGTPGLDLLPYLSGVGVLIVVDTVKGSGAPGEVRLYRRDDILKHAPDPRLSPHDPGLGDALLTLQLSGGGPDDVLLVGIIPTEVKTGVGLSDAAKAAVPRAVAAVVDALTRRGFPPRPRRAPQPPDLWWERP
jgi:hydrogenase maturation protease